MLSGGGSCAPRIAQAERSCLCSHARISAVNAQCASTLAVAPSRGRSRPSCRRASESTTLSRKSDLQQRSPVQS